VVKYFKFIKTDLTYLIPSRRDASGKSQKRFKKRELQNLTMNEIVQKHFKCAEPQKRVRIV
jgi:hypothetical protein